MLHSKHNFFVITTVLALAACTGPDKKQEESKASSSFSEIEKAAWLLGVWQSNSPEGVATEFWNKENDSLYTGQSFYIIGTDTVSFESLELSQNGSSVFYRPTVKGQNNGESVEFKLTSSSDSALVFENPAHDFPQKIAYKMITRDSLNAEISGLIKGEKHAEVFALGRVR